MQRAAVLSEASMVNKMEYRVECQILSSLHRHVPDSAHSSIDSYFLTCYAQGESHIQPVSDREGAPD